MVSQTSRYILYALAAIYAVLGAIMFVDPTYGAANFAWRISPNVSITMGAWYLGWAWLAWVVARRATWPLVLAPVLALSLYGVIEAGVLVAFRELLRTAGISAWLYLLAIAGTCLLALSVLIDWLRQRPQPAVVGPKVRPVDLAVLWFFIISTGMVGVSGLLGPLAHPGFDAALFPERMSPFSNRAFGAFYFAVALGAVPLVWARGLGSFLSFAYALFAMLVLIVIGFLIFLGTFDFVAKPTQAIYFGFYVLIGGILVVYFSKYGSGGKVAANAR